MSRMWLTAPLWALWGCGSISSPTDYADARAQASCDKLQRCELGFFDSEYSGIDDCVRELSNELDDDADALDELDCKFDKEEANRCVSRISSLTCEEWSEGNSLSACDLVYYCEEFGGTITSYYSTDGR